MKLLELRKINGDRPLKAFCDVEIIPGVICKEFRILEFPGRRPRVDNPQTAFKDPATGQIRYRTLIILSDALQGEVELLLLNAWHGERGKSSGSSPVE